MREIVFDTETTGLSPDNGDRVIEIGAVELENRFPTGRSFHAYVSPQGRAVHPDALQVHGITDDFLRDKPDFAAVADSFLDFVADADLVAHNACFDMRFINSELARLGRPAFPDDRVVDTLVLARRRHPMGPNSLDALCGRYGIDNAHRTKHGALLDSELLAEVYIEMTGGRQAALVLDAELEDRRTVVRIDTAIAARRQRPAPLAPRISPEEIRRHREFIGAMGDAALWLAYDIRAGIGP